MCLLSICIPTYNRADVLEKCVETIVLENGFDSRVEIIILDNDSSDHTEIVAKRFTQSYSNVFYFKNKENIGMEKNILKVLEYGRGKLLKLCNDYCLFNKGTLEELLDLIVDNCDQSSILYFHNKHNTSSVAICEDLNCFFKKVTYWPTWIGTFSIWKNDFDLFNNTQSFEGLLFPHLMMFLENFEAKKKVKIIYKPLFYDIPGIKKGGYDFFEVFVQNFVGKILHEVYSAGKINLITLYEVKSAFYHNFLKKWSLRVIFEKNHSFKNDNISLIYKYFKFYPEFYLFIIYDMPKYKILQGIKALKNNFF
jgi:glycosyltransferase involved in cell wall biosynthesis